MANGPVGANGIIDPFYETPRADIFGQYPPASWTVDDNDDEKSGLGQTIYFPVLSVKESGGNRIVRRTRPYRDGAMLDDTGAREIVWTLEVMHENSIAEDSVSDGIWYPQRLNDLLDSFKSHKTGSLVLPTRGRVRARAESYERTEDNSERDAARCTLVFVEDNEDDVTAEAFSNPSVTAYLIQAERDTTFSCESLGVFSQTLADLEKACSDVQDAIAAPGEMLQDVDQKVARVARILQDTEKQFSVTTKFGSDLLTDPDAWATLRQLRTMRDRAPQAAQEKAKGRVVSKVFGVQLSIFDVATELAQDSTDLINLNPQIEDLLAIPAGTAVRVFGR